MYLSRIELNRSGPGVTSLLKSLAVDDYRHHQFVWRLFEGVDERDFLYRREDAGHWPRYYTVSEREPQDDDGLWTIDIKPYTPRIEKGMRLAFSLRANPVVTRKNGDGRRQRHDVVMDHKKRIGFKDMPPRERPSLQAIIRDAGLAWLRPRAERHGFSFEEGLITVDGYEQHKSSKRRGTKTISFSTLDFGGLLTVTDEQAFREALFSGIGPAKGLGCGLLMVRRV
ncbi:CRISPR-associated protein Cse3 [Thiohalobacter thiocyanaticus]|uniref:CRISPR-associated protein Cse3 n=1 Tax=Thiohalobacter thiocyanaticus TaxID=585455 RepID=A0A1Z4VUI5_9GAMM|nr:type I-E CRISPR-associated protein Cas6/Cse3/CasE [Thiohalobacter thiocyanaticus]BAZ95173.1 CRISPR-associated protein Cse3 [Thiohalobacter thiocyanaticus]